jgi:predicted  nucleic acid-binding Zn-ribbon protein
MALNDYQNLLEVQSIERYIKKHLDIQEEEKKRLTFLEGQKSRKVKEGEEKGKELEQSKQLLSSLEVELDKHQRTLEQTEQHISQAKNEREVESLEKELKHLVLAISTTEEKALDEMEKLESLTQAKEVNSHFLKGFKETYSEIKEEVDQACEENQSDINRYNERVKLLVESTAPEFVRVFTQINQKLRFQSPLAFLIEKNCSKCRFILDNMTINRIELGNKPEPCPQCSRLLVPSGVNNSSK